MTARPAIPTSAQSVLLVLLGALALGGLLPALRPAPASAGEHQLSIMMDDDRLIYRSDRTRVQTLTAMKNLGVEYVRVTVLWKSVAATARDTPTRRRRFQGDQPNSYPRGTWDRYDQLVREASAMGIGVYFDVTGPGPRWGHARAPKSQKRSQGTWKPKPAEFAKFVAAVGRRYSGTFKDRAGAPIPRVSFWSLWNEPNQGGWLTPQWAYSARAHAVIAESPILYRRLYFGGRQALEGTGHGGDFIMAGETAPLGSDRRSSRSPMRPKKFIRELMCADDQGQPYQGAAAAARACSVFGQLGQLRATAWAHHPYTKKVGPAVRDPSADSLTMANLSDLPDLLDRLAASSGHLAAGMFVVSSEFGFETNPPDPFNGMPLGKQAEYINVGDHITYRLPRVVGQTQFQLVDAAPLTKYPKGSRKYWFTYQAGLSFLDGRPKPALPAYALPLVATPGAVDPATGHRQVAVWGQLRPHDRGVAAAAGDKVQVEFRGAGGADFQPVGAPIAITNAEAFFTGQVEVPSAGTLRLHWSGSAAPNELRSREVAIGA